MTEFGILEFLDVSANPASYKIAEASVACEAAVEAGYSRLWVTEHHSDVSASSNPLLVIAHLAGLLPGPVRYGTAASLVRLHNTGLLVEDFRWISRLVNGRLDVGLGRGSVPPDVATQLGLEPLDDERVDDAICRLAEELELPRSSTGDPTSRKEPELWLHGSGVGSAKIASNIGANYCHALFLNPDIEACASVREHLGISSAKPEGKFGIALSMRVDPDRWVGEKPGFTLNLDGSVDRIIDGIEYCISRVQPDLVMIADMSHLGSERAAGYAELSDGLKDRGLL